MKMSLPPKHLFPPFVSRQIYDFPPKSWHPKIQNPPTRPPPSTINIKSVAAAEPPTPSRSRASTYPLPPLAQPSTIDPLSDHGSRRHRCRCCCHQWRHSARSLLLLLHHFCCLGACLVAPLEICDSLSLPATAAAAAATATTSKWCYEYF